MLNLSFFTIHCDIIKLNITEHCFLLSGFNLSILLVNNILYIFNTSFNLFKSPWLKFRFFSPKHQSVLETVYEAVSVDLGVSTLLSAHGMRLSAFTMFCSQWCTDMKTTPDKPPGLN